MDFLYYDGSPPSYDYEYYNDYNDISKVTILELSRKILPYISNSIYYFMYSKSAVCCKLAMTYSMTYQGKLCLIKGTPDTIIANKITKLWHFA